MRLNALYIIYTCMIYYSYVMNVHFELFRIHRSRIHFFGDLDEIDSFDAMEAIIEVSDYE